MKKLKLKYPIVLIHGTAARDNSLSHAGITDIGRMRIGNLNIPQVYLDIVERLKNIGL